LPPGHETDESDEADDFDWIADSETAREAHDMGESEVADHARWTPAHHAAFLFFVEQVSHGARARLQEAAKQFEEDCVEGEGPPSLRNHCIQCGAMFDDQDLFCEPGGAFLPTSVTEAGKVSLVAVDQAIQATIDGYAYEPEFFEFMTRT
jgi:hypothetical protein